MHAIVACGAHRSSALKHERRRTFFFTTNMARPGFRSDFSRHRWLSGVRNVVARRMTARSNIQPTKSAQGHFVRFLADASHTHDSPTNVPADGHGRAIVRRTAGSLPSLLRNAWNQNDSGRTSAYGGGSDNPPCSNRSAHCKWQGGALLVRRVSTNNQTTPLTFQTRPGGIRKVSGDQQALEIFRDRRFEHQAFARDGMDEHRPPRV